MSTHIGCRSVSFVMHIFGARFEQHHSNISREILDSVFYCLSVAIRDVVTFYILQNTKT